MYSFITINKGTELQTEEWRFIIIESKIILDSYALKVRETKRHKFQLEKAYTRIGDRGYGSGRLKATEVPLSEELKAEAKQKYVDSLTVCLDL